MKAKDLLYYVICGIVAVVAIALAWRLIKFLLGLLAAGTSILLVLLYAFAPVIIVVLLLMIYRNTRKR